MAGFDYLQKYYTVAASKIFFLGAFALLAGCSSETGKPKGHLREDKMAQVLSDQLLGEAFAIQKSADMGISPIVMLDSIIYPAIYLKYDLDSTTYKASLAYYEKDPERLKALFIAVEKLLAKKDKDAIKAPIHEDPPNTPPKMTPEQFREMARKRMGGGATP